MDEIIERPKYSRQTGTQRKRRKEPNVDLLPTAFAAKLLVVVIFLSILALCKAADTPTTKNLISKVKVITTNNLDMNKYFLNVATTLGLKLPDETQVQQKNIVDNPETTEQAKDDVQVSSTVNEINQTTQKDNVSEENIENIATEENIKEDSTKLQTLNEFEIKEIADKHSFISPIKGNIASPFGSRTDPLTGKAQFHSGIDIEANMGASIKAALAGEVIEVGSNPEYDNYVKIKHIDDMVTVYAHCSLLIAKMGQKVNQGDLISKVGDTEGLGGAYLHFEVWKGSKVLDPEKLLSYLNQ